MLALSLNFSVTTMHAYPKQRQRFNFVRSIVGVTLLRLRGWQTTTVLSRAALGSHRWPVQAADRTIDACVRAYACANGNNMAILACSVFIASSALLVKAVAMHVWLLSNFAAPQLNHAVIFFKQIIPWFFLGVLWVHITCLEADLTLCSFLCQLCFL